MPVCAHTFKKERMRPYAPALTWIEMSLGAADGLINKSRATRQPDPARPGVAFEEFVVRQPGDKDVNYSRMRYFDSLNQR